MQPDANHAHNENGPRWSLTIRITVAVIAIVLVLIAAYAFRVAFVPLIIGGLIAYVLTPVVKWINKVTRLPKGLATLVVFLVVFALLILVIALVQPAELSAQGVLLYNDVLAYVEQLQARSTDTVTVLGFTFAIGDLVEEATASLAQLARSAAPRTVGLVFNAARTALLVIFTLFIGFYLTRDGDKFIAALKKLAPLRLAPLRFGRILGFSSRHSFQTSTPCLRISRCSGLAICVILLRATLRPRWCIQLFCFFPK